MEVSGGGEERGSVFILAQVSLFIKVILLWRCKTFLQVRQQKAFREMMENSVDLLLMDGRMLPLLHRECPLSCWGWGGFHCLVPGRSAQCPVVCQSRSLSPSPVRPQSISTPSTWKKTPQKTFLFFSGDERPAGVNLMAEARNITTCWFNSMISASLPPFLDKDGFFLMAGVLCWTRCGVGMFLGTVGDVLCGPGARWRNDQ